MDDTLDMARRSLESMSGLRLELAAVENSGGTYPALRPADLAGVPAFSIALSRSAAWAEAMFLPDRFSGALVRGIGDQILLSPGQWQELVEQGSRDGVDTAIWINNQPSEVRGLPEDTWRHLEIECRVRLRQPGPDSVEDGFVRSAGLCMSLLLVGLKVEQIDEPEQGVPEGARTTITANRYERNPVNRLMCIQHHGYECWACDFDFRDIYGELGANFIQVHHITAVSEMPRDYIVDPQTEMVPLCSNCHSMVHREKPALRPEALRALIGRPPRGVVG